MKGRFFFYCGVFILTLSTLMLEIIQTRILSVMVWYHMAFLAISMAMFGMTAGAVWIYFRLHAMDSLTAAKNLTFYTWAFGLAILFSLIGQFSLALVHNASLTYYLTWLLLAAYMALPFFFSGAAVTLALTRTPFPIHRVYAVDLIGAAVGCLGVLFLLNYTDGPSAVLWTAMAAELGAFSFWLYWRTNETDYHARPAAWTSPIWLIFLLGLAAFFNGATFHGLHPIFSKEKLNERTYPLVYERWNSFSCVRVFEHPKSIPPNLWGPSQIMPGNIRAQIKRMYIDGAAGTVLPHFSGEMSEIDYVKYDLPNLGYFIRNQGKGLVIGVGGGRDVLSAKWFGMDEVIGVEINPIFIDILTDHPRFADFNQVNRLPGVTLHVDEARSWLARSQETFDSMQISMIDTWASTTAGAFSLSENGLYTLEAWELFLSHLNQDGILTVTRWYAPGEVNETGRLIGLA
ncbi:hypothetical protein GF373_11435, partial [bacterium]|nr:hypothetical protein [bacterium]